MIVLMSMNHLTRFASDLFGSLQEQMACMGGMWPKSTMVDGKLFTFYTKQYSPENELQAVTYRAKDGSVLTVYND